MPSAAACETACAALDQCDQLPSIDLPEDQPVICVAACSGASTADPEGLGATLACIEAALQPTCDEAALGLCVGTGPPPDDLCVAVCSAFFDPASEQLCAPGTWMADHWSVAECAAGCASLAADDGLFLRFYGCLLVSGCGPPDACLSPPAEDDPGCGLACGAMSDLCGGLANLGDPVQCPPLCTGIVHGLGVSASAESGTCIAAAETCPADEEGENALFFGCLVTPPEACAPICEALVPCAGPDLTQEGCEQLCAFGTLGPAEALPGVQQCVSAATPSCPAVFACLPEPEDPQEPEDLICAPLCAKSSGECGITTADLCAGACLANVGAGIGYLAEAACLLVAPCDDLLACITLGSGPAPAACTDACAAAGDTCAGYADGCPRACQGLLAGLGLPPVQAQCVVDTLGAACDPVAAAAAFAPL